MTRSFAENLTRIATLTSVIHTRGQDAERRVLNGGTPSDLRSRQEAVVERLEKVCERLEKTVG